MTLPTPAVLQPLDYEAILADVKAEIVSRMPDAAATIQLESEPLAIVAQAFAYRELVYRAHLNTLAAAQLIEYAEGPDLDHKADFYGLTRAPGEADARLRERLRLAIAALAGGGTAQAYESRALAAHPGVRQAKATQPTPGSITVLIWPQDGYSPTEVLAAVTTTLNADNARILGVPLTVALAQPVPLHVTATIATDATAPADLLAQLADRLADQLASYARIGKSVPRSWVSAQLYQPGVSAVTFPGPSAPPELLTVAAGQYAELGVVILTHGAVT